MRDEDLQAALAAERLRGNFSRLRTLLPVLAVLHVAAAIAFTFVPVPAEGAEAKIVAWTRNLRWANGGMGLLAAVFALLVRSATVGGAAARFGRRLPEAAAFGYLGFAAVVAAIDHPVTGGLTAYMVAVFAVAFFARMPASVSTACYCAGGIVLWVAFGLLGAPGPQRFSAVVNGMVLTVLGWGLSLILDRAFVRDVLSARTIATQQRNLERVNDRLADSLNALQRANAELVQEVRVRTLAERELARLATNDPLTDVANRRRFFEIAGQERGRAVAAGGALAVAMLDIDRFKPINDEHGHAVGDEVLRLVAAQCTAAAREGDAVGRLGGDEFAVLMVGADLAAAQAVAERIAGAVRGIEISTRDGPVRPTVSIGVSEVAPAEPSAISAALERADAAMYRAKREAAGVVAVPAPARRD